MKQAEIIRWTKTYQEDVGAKDDYGLYDYAYCYYIYRFYLPDESEMLARRYTDTPEKCAVFLPADSNNNAADIARRKAYVCSISEFLLEEEGVSKIEHFYPDKGYRPIDTAYLKCRPDDFSFQTA